MGFLRLNSGTITILGGNSQDPEVRRKIGYLPGDAGFDKRMSVGQVLDWYARLRGCVDPGLRSRLVGRFALDESRRVGQLSTGNRRKLGIVQALMHDPDVLILDEPSSGLDPLVQHELVAAVREQAAKGAAVIFSSHVLSEVEAVADRVAMMRSGRLVHEGDVASLRAGIVQRLEFRTESPIPDGLLLGLPGIRVVEQTDLKLLVDIQGSTSQLINRLAPLGVQHLVAHRQDLEDLFFQYYRDSEQPDPAAASNSGGGAS